MILSVLDDISHICCVDCGVRSGREKLIALILREGFSDLLSLQLWVQQLNVIAIVDAAIKFNCNCSKAIIEFIFFFLPSPREDLGFGLLIFVVIFVLLCESRSGHFVLLRESTNQRINGEATHSHWLLCSSVN